MLNITILGTGGWGTAIAALAAAPGNRVRLWGRDAAYVDNISKTRENPRALPGAKIPASIEITADPARAVEGAQLIFVTIPAQFLRKTLAAFHNIIPPGVPVVSGVKGLEIGTLKRPGEIMIEALGERRRGVLSGPSHAEEIMLGLPVSLTMASEDLNLAKTVRDAMGSAALRIYVERDALGVELAGALKNVIAIAAGVCDGLGLGDNAKAALITRGLAEMLRYGVARGARADTYYGLAGVGDLMTTCYSRHGRNRGVGERVARGESLQTILASTTQVAEGVWTVKALREAAPAEEFAEALPICAEIYSILYDNKSPRRSVYDLMTRPPRENV